jgi:hypothetical protein
VEQNRYEYQSYNYLLIAAHKLSERALEKRSRRDLTFAHLWEEPAKYRGELIHLEGRLRRLVRFDATKLQAQQGVKALYEAWVFSDQYRFDPYCVVLSEIPASIKTGERLDYHVSLDAFFFKRYRYRAGDGSREAPLLIGRGLVATTPPAPEPDSEWSFVRMALPAFLSLIVATVLLVIGLNWWFRRGDRRVRTRLDMVRDAGFVDPSDKKS